MSSLSYKYLFYIGVIWLFCACQSPDAITEEVAVAQAGKTIQNEPTPVKLAVATQKIFEHTIQAQGKLDAPQQVSLQFQNMGLLEKIYAENGDYIQKGAKIATQETTLLHTALAKAQQDVLNKKQDYLILCCNFGYCLADTAKLSTKQRIQWMAQSGLQLALIQVQEAQIRIDQSKLQAPFSGRIANLMQRQGDMSDLSKPFCTLYNPNRLEVAVEVIESDYGRITPNTVATIQVLSMPNRTYKAKLVRTNPIVNERGMVLLHFQLLETKELLPGMNAQVTIRIPTEKRLVVPKEAVVLRSGKNVVFTAENGMAKWNYVTTGEENGNEIAILEGLKPNSQVIITNALQLAHESAVEIED